MKRVDEPAAAHTVYSFRMLVLTTGALGACGFPLKHLELRLLNGAYSGLQQKGESPMRIIGLVAMTVWLSACTTTPMFPPAIMKNVEANTFDVKAWEEQAYHPSGVKFVPHKVELAGLIIKVIQKPDGVAILAEEQLLDTHPVSSQTNIQQDGAPWFAITFSGSVQSSLLQAGNRLIAVGTTYRASPEMLGGAPRMLPHLRAQCLHIWDTEGVKNMHVYSDAGFARDYPAEERTFCLESSNASSSSSDSQGDVKKASGGS